MDKDNKSFGIDFLGENSDCINTKEIREVLIQDKTEMSYKIEKALKNEDFVLNRQELNYLSAHEKNKWIEYLIYRYKFRNYPNKEIITRYPIYVILEPSSACNLQCIMCFQRDPELKKKAGMMSWNLFKKVIDEVAGSECKAITIAGRGEPLLNPAICNMLDYLKGKFLEIKLNTNGLLMNEEVTRSILRNNINVVFSAEGTNAEEYEQIRYKGDFEKLIQNIRNFNIIREKEFSSSTTRTRVSGVAFDNIDKSKYQEFWEKLVDEVAIVEYEERKDTYHNATNCVKDRCARLWQSVYIWYDGVVSPCDIDYLNKLAVGDIKKEKMCDIWMSEQLVEIRKLHKDGLRCKIVPCKQCEWTDV